LDESVSVTWFGHVAVAAVAAVRRKKKKRRRVGEGKEKK